MASSTVLRRKRLISDWLSVSARHVYAIRCCDSRGYSSYGNNQDFLDLNRGKERNVSSVAKAGFLGLFWFGQFERKSYGIGDGRYEYVSPMGFRLMSHLVRSASTATAKQPEMGSDDEGMEELVSKKRKEATAEECDQAVEGLSTAKAKAKAKKLQESQKIAKTVLQKTWATLVGIGPALRAVASMSREDWAKKLVHWKHEFVSTLQHYLLGFKLLWVDVRISSRLLLKLAGGKSLSRRERQQLT